MTLVMSGPPYLIYSLISQVRDVSPKGEGAAIVYNNALNAVAMAVGPPEG